MRSNGRNNQGGNTAVSVGGRRWRHCCLALIVLTMICGAIGPLHAKVDAGISGIVTDASGAVVAGAAVQATEVETGIVTRRQTNADGFYAFVDLQPGHYNIEVSQTGFTTYRQTGIELDVNSAKVVNVKLNVGQIGTTVSVEVRDSPSVPFLIGKWRGLAECTVALLPGSITL